MPSPDPRPAGEFATWLGGLQRVLTDDDDADVPCDGCTACCRSAQFVHVAPDEADALAHIPTDLLFPAPRLPRGHMVMGFDAEGRCPLLGEGGCSIYAHRPRTCRAYDCRVFTAAGVDPGPDKPAIAQRVAQWQFAYGAEASPGLHDAVLAAARFAAEHLGAPSPTETALAAVRAHRLFLGGAEPSPDDVLVELRRAR